MTLGLANKYRPAEFTDVVGQSVTTKILNKIIETRSFKNCYLFAGASGCGKTTLARIFADKINNSKGQYIEIDAASNGGVENIRAIMESASQRSLTGEYKIFIIDECHAISTAGFQAFLKGIEETPKYTIFIFCTTEPHKIPATILNRVQRFNIAPLKYADIRSRLNYICAAENFINYEKTCDLISKNCGGCLRDAITTLNQCADFSRDLSLNIVKDFIGNSSYESLFNLTWAIIQKDTAKIINVLDALYDSGVDLRNFIDSYLEFVLNLFKYSLFRTADVTSIPEYLASVDNPVVQDTVAAMLDSTTSFEQLIECLLKLKQLIKYDNMIKTTIEAELISYCRG